MPMYDFRCDPCNKTFEAITDTEIRTHPCECGGEARRMISAPLLATLTVPSYPGCRARMAGYVHDYKRPKTPGKIQVGYGS